MQIFLFNGSKQPISGWKLNIDILKYLWEDVRGNCSDDKISKLCRQVLFQSLPTGNYSKNIKHCRKLPGFDSNMQTIIPLYIMTFSAFNPVDDVNNNNFKNGDIPNYFSTYNDNEMTSYSLSIFFATFNPYEDVQNV